MQLTGPALVLLVTLAAAAPALAAWEKVPPMKWDGIALSDFADHELDVPYHLEHFHTVANAVVEEGPDRGFIGIAVNRDRKDNKPYNARIMENAAWFAYFYATDKPWNPYHGSPAVRERLEAMLDFWTRRQNPDGRFSEYSEDGWNLAATGFGVLFMSQTLERLTAAGAPPIDPDILERTIAAQRKGIMAILTSPELRRIATSYHNQYSGVYRAAISFLKMRPDPEMQKALVESGQWFLQNTQSPAGFFYEASFPDFGYSHVHDANLHNAEPLFEQAPPAVQQKLLEEYRRYMGWLAHNLVLEPDRVGYFVNAAIQNRTAFAFQPFKDRPLAGRLPETWAFSITQADRDEQTRRRREQLGREWPKLPPLQQYAPRHGFTATDGNPTRFPTAEQRDGEIAKLPYLAKTRYATLRYDPRRLGVLAVRRPGYLALLNFGRSANQDKPVLGLGLLWNEEAGTVAQALPTPNDHAWGTKLDGQDRFVESRTVEAKLVSAGRAVPIQPGIHDVADGTIVATYPLGDAGEKTITFENDRIVVATRARGGFIEQIPLVLRKGDELKVEGNRVTRTRGNATLTITVENGTIELQPETTFRIGSEDARRIRLHLRGTDTLSYTLSFGT
jgi:hypothetical protein